jgi:hypothetical protein
MFCVDFWGLTGEHSLGLECLDEGEEGDEPVDGECLHDAGLRYTQKGMR